MPISSENNCYAKRTLSLRYFLICSECKCIRFPFYWNSTIYLETSPVLDKRLSRKKCSIEENGFRHLLSQLSQ